MNRGLPYAGKARAEPAASALPEPSRAADPRAPYVRLAVAGLIRRDDARAEGCVTWLLLHRREPVDAWDPPGGRMEEGEDLTTAVLREVAEETGLTVEVAGPCYSLLTVYKGEGLLVVTMACRQAGDPEGVRLEPEGAVEWRWVSAEEWEELAASGRSSWRARDVSRATRMVTVLWEMEED
jgi:8-oxo-dGTP pyrophosphatase MutT (NUDIX family)